MNLMLYIVWNPDNAIFDLGFFALRWYSLLFASGFILSYILLKHRFEKENIPLKRLEKLTIYVALATFIGARLGHVIFYDFDYYSKHIVEIFLPFTFEPEFEFTGYQGLASHGGAIGILIAVILFSRKYNFRFLWVFDKLALVIPLVGGLIRIGNLMNSEIIGKPATVSWAFIFEKVDQVPRHPAQLYEAIGYFLLFIFLQIRSKRFKSDGVIFGLFLTLLFSSRFLIEFFKENQSAFEAGMFLNMGQILSIPFIIGGVILIFKPKSR